MTDRRAELEATIEADPYDRRAFAVLGDYLQELGDPRGELIALQLAPRRGAVEDAAARLIASSNLGFAAGVDARWSFGYARAIRIDAPTPDLLAATLAHPSARFLLELGLQLRDPNIGLEAEIGVLASQPQRCLRTLEVAIGTGERLAWLGEVGTLWRALPQLRRLRLMGGHVISSPFALPLVEELEIGSFRLQANTPESIAASRWPALTSLALRPGACSNDTIDAIAGIWAVGAAVSTRFPKLTRLRFSETNQLDYLVQHLVRSPILAQLTELSLTSGSLTDEGVDRLVENASAIRHLERLDVSGNAISGDGHARLRAIVGSIDAAPGELDDVDPDLYDY